MLLKRENKKTKNKLKSNEPECMSHFFLNVLAQIRNVYNLQVEVHGLHATKPAAAKSVRIHLAWYIAYPTTKGYLEKE